MEQAPPTPSPVPVLTLEPLPDGGTGSGSDPVPDLQARPEPDAPERCGTLRWYLAALLATGFWSTAWTRRVAQATPQLRQVLAVAGLSAGVGLVALRLAEPSSWPLSWSAPGFLWTGWSLLAVALCLAALVHVQGLRGAKARERFWAAATLGLGGLSAAALWWLVLSRVMVVLGAHHPEVALAWMEQVAPVVAVALAASAFWQGAWAALPRRRGLLLGALGLLGVMGLAQQLTPLMPWLPDEAAQAEMQATDKLAGPEMPRPMVFTPATFERQQAAFAQAVARLAPPDARRINLYGILFAPYAGEDVFRNETRMLAELLGSRFDARDRVLTLLNHRDTAETLPWATAENLRRAVLAVAAVMDRERDILFVYLTSHGGRDHQLAGDFAPIHIPPLDARVLRDALDEAGIRHRVVAVSACYSGGWIDVLRGEHTLVMTAADAEHTSYGCGHGSELTYFGRAVFHEQLRQTRSFETAFRQAVPIIARREVEGGKTDGFSNPQIAVGAAMAAYLRRFEAQWAPAPVTAR